MNKHQKNRVVRTSYQKNKEHTITSTRATNIDSEDMNIVKLKDLGSMIENLNENEILVVDLQGEKNDK